MPDVPKIHGIGIQLSVGFYHIIPQDFFNSTREFEFKQFTGI